MIFKNRTNKSLSYGQKRMERQSHKVGSRSCHLRTDNYVTPKLLSTCDYSLCTHYSYPEMHLKSITAPPANWQAMANGPTPVSL